MLQISKFIKHTKEEVKERFYDSWLFSYNKLLTGSYLEKSSIAIVNMIPVLIQFFSLELSVAIGVAQYCLLKYGDLTLITINQCINDLRLQGGLKAMRSILSTVGCEVVGGALIFTIPQGFIRNSVLTYAKFSSYNHGLMEWSKKNDKKHD